MTTPILVPGTWWHPDAGIQKCEKACQTVNLQMISNPVAQEDVEITICAESGTYGTYFVQSQHALLCIQSLWEGNFLPHTEQQMLLDQFVITEETIQLVPKKETQLQVEDSPEWDESHNVLLLRKNQALIAFDVNSKDPWNKILKDFPGLRQALQDQYGEIPIHSVISHLTLLHMDPPPSIEVHTSPLDVHLFEFVQVEKIRVPNTDILKVILMGDRVLLEQVISWWQKAFSKDWQELTGRNLAIQEIETEKWQLLFVPTNAMTGIIPIPTTALVKMIPVRLMQTFLPKLATNEDSSVKCIFKITGRTLAVTGLAPTMQLGAVCDAMKHAYQINEFGQMPSLVSLGARVGMQMTPQDLLSKKRVIEGEPRRYAVLHVIMPQIGGGVPDLGAKNTYRQVIQSKTAGLLLEMGMTMPHVSQATTALIDQMGYPRLNHLIHVESPTTRYETLAMLCQECNISLPDQKKRAHTEARIRKQAKSSKLEQEEDFEVAAYVLQEGFFHNADDTPAKILPAFQPNLNGVFLANIKQAESWLHTPQPISTDELAMFVAGMQSPQTALPWQTCQAPAHNQQGRAVLLQGTLIQFGSKAIKLPASNDVDMARTKVQVCSISVYRDDYDQSTWEAILQSPVKTVKSLLTLQGFGAVIGRPWGRTYKLDEAPTTPHLSTSVHFHAEVANERFEQLLARSGFLKVFLMPKDEEGKPSSNYRMIWYSGTPSNLDALTAGLPGVAGLVRTKKGYGLRVHKDSFDALWKIINPEQEPPQQNNFPYVYRVQPFPNGTSKEDIQQWGQEIQWPVKAIRTTGAKQWILGSQTEIPHMILWNGHPLIAQHLPTKAPRPTIIVAGPPSAKHQQRFRPEDNHRQHEHVENTQDQHLQDPFRHSDPWMDWKKKHNEQWSRPATALNTMATSSTAATPTSSRNFADKDPQQRALTGPVAAQFQAQETRLQALESVVQQIQGDQKTQATQIAAQFQAVDQKIQQCQTETQAGLAKLVEDNKEVKQVLSRQDEKFLGAFAELKSLFTQHGTKRNRSHPFHGAPETDEELMEEEPNL